MDFESEIIEILEQDSFTLYDPFQLDPELVLFDLKNNGFIETSTPTDFQNQFNSTNSFEKKPNKTFKQNDFVCINEKKYGFVKFQGKVHFAKGYFCGIELVEQDGKHDGKIDNIR